MVKDFNKYRKENYRNVFVSSPKSLHDMIEAQVMLNEIMAANFNDLMKVIYFQIKKIHLDPSRLMCMNSIPKHTVENISIGNVRRNTKQMKDYLKIDQ